MIFRCKSDNQSTFALNYEKEVYYSRDHGNNWHNLQPIIKKSTNSPWGISWSFVKLTQSPANHDHMIISSDTNNNWVTDNCGQNWYLTADHLNLHTFRYHPHLEGKVLAMSRKTCGAEASTRCKEYNVLYYSEDSGKNWKPIQTHVYKAIWGREARYGYGINPLSIFIIRQENKKRSQPERMSHYSKVAQTSVYFSDDLFNRTRKVVSGGFRMMVSRCCLFVQKPTIQSTKILVSEVWNNHFRWLNVNLLEDESYVDFRIINDLNSFKTYMYATREVGDNREKVSDLLKSDYSSANYTLIHSNLVVNTNNRESSFTELEALEDLSIINVYDEAMLDFLERQNDEEDDLQSGGQGTSRSKNQRFKVKKRNFVKTKISFNSGGNYKLLKPPSVDSYNEPYTSCSTCSLHLHTQESENFPQVYSSKTAPGLLLGVGNVGRHLKYKNSQLATFVSLDGGVSWKEMLKGVHIYEIGDQGGLIVLAPYGIPTSMVIVSHDYGATLKAVTFTKSPVMVSLSNPFERPSIGRVNQSSTR